MPRSGDPSPAGIADQGDVLECALHAMRDEIIRLRHYVAQLEAQVRALEEQNEAAPRRQQEWRAEDFDLRDGFRVCRPQCGRDFRIHPHHAEDQFGCGVCRNNMGHSARSEARGRPSGAAATNWQTHAQQGHRCDNEKRISGVFHTSRPLLSSLAGEMRALEGSRTDAGCSVGDRRRGAN